MREVRVSVPTFVTLITTIVVGNLVKVHQDSFYAFNPKFGQIVHLFSHFKPKIGDFR